MRRVTLVNATAVWTLLLILGATASVVAQDASAELQGAIKLFDAGDYLAAQEALVDIDPEKLSDRERPVREEYLAKVQTAIQMYEKAVRDLDDATLAIESQDYDRARALLNDVLANQYAPAVVREAATAQLRDLKGMQPAAPAEQPAERTEVTITETETVEPADELTPMDRARILTAEGDAALAASRFDEARGLYNEALAQVPGYPDAVEGLNRVAQHEQNIAGPRAESLEEVIRRQDAINWQRTVVHFRSAQQAVEEAMQADRYEEANQQLVRAGQILAAGRQYADPISLYEELQDDLDRLTKRVREAERAYHEREVARVRSELERERARRLREIDKRKQETIDGLMEQARQHRKDGDLAAAVNVLRQVVELDRTHDEANYQLDFLEDAMLYRQERDVHQTFYKETRKRQLTTEEAKVPWADDLRYPKDWIEIINRPERNLPGHTAQDSLILGMLDTPTPLDIRHESFDHVIERLATAHDLNIIVNWADLRLAGVERATPIDLSVPGEVTLKKALTEVLTQAGAGTVDIGFDVADGAINVATQQTLDKQTYTAVYDISDLLMEIPNFTDAPISDLNDSSREALAAARDTRTGLWQAAEPVDAGEEDVLTGEAQNRMSKIVNMIMDQVSPESWVERGGTVGTISEINNQLVITQNSGSQQQVRDLLSKLREQRAIQIGIEARFIVVSSHYLEDLGLDIDVVLNSGNAGFDFIPTGFADAPITSDPVLGSRLLLPREFSRLGFGPATPARGTALTSPGGLTINQPFINPASVPLRGSGGSFSNATPIPITNNTLDFTNPANLTSDIPGTFAGTSLGPAFSLTGSFLDNIQVDFLLRATQADSRTTVLTAPQLVLSNGQRSWIAVTLQRAFVSQLIPQLNVGAAAQLPVTGTINAGAVLDVQAVVTADKRYVQMTVRPGVTRLNSLETFQTSGGGTAGDAFLQLPSLSSQLIKTTVNVPDGGTLLIGGQKLASETEIEAGVPVLSKIPILKRAYSSRSMVKDEQTLLILIKPKVFIQSEQERMAFPTFSGG